jgi:hypothetical protein
MSKHHNPQPTAADLAVVLAAPVAPATAVMSFDDFSADANEGSKDLGIGDIAIPFFSILQGLSPQCTEGTPKFNENARPGMILNNVTGELIKGKDGIAVLRAAYVKELIEWKPRESGGGLVARYGIENPIARTTTPNEKGQPVLPNGNFLVETAEHFVIVVGQGKADWAQIPMKSSQLKYSARWNSLISGQTMVKDNGESFHLPSYAVIYRLRTQPDKNGKGQTYFSWEITKEGIVSDPRQYEAAKSYREAVTSGALKATLVNEETVPAHGGGKLVDDDVPF